MRYGLEEARKDRKVEIKITQDTSILERERSHIDTVLCIIMLTDPEKQFYIL